MPGGCGGAGWGSQPHGGTQGGLPPSPPWPCPCPQPAWGRPVGPSSDTVAVLQGTARAAATPGATRVPPCHLCPSVPTQGSRLGPPRVPLLQDPLRLGFAPAGAAPRQRGVPPAQPCPR